MKDAQAKLDALLAEIAEGKALAADLKITEQGTGAKQYQSVLTLKPSKFEEPAAAPAKAK